MSLELEATTDVLAALSAERRDGQVLIGFAAEHGDVAVPNARGKLERKKLDAVVVNDISRPGIGFDTPENEVTIVLPGERAAGSPGLEGGGRRGHRRRDRGPPGGASHCGRSGVCAAAERNGAGS